MPEVYLQPSKVIEIDDDKVIGRIGRVLLVSRAVHQPFSEAHASHRGNLADRELECRGQCLALARLQISANLEQDNVTHHAIIATNRATSSTECRRAHV